MKPEKEEYFKVSKKEYNDLIFKGQLYDN